MVATKPEVLVPTASVADALQAKGINTYCVVAYGQPPLTPSQCAYYLSQGFKIYPWQNGSDGYTSDLTVEYDGFAAGGGGALGPTYGWGYATQFYDLGRGWLAALYPNEQEYYLSGGVLSPATSYAIKGIVIDAPELVTEWLYEYSQIQANLGLGNLLGIAGWVGSDNPVNYGGAQGASGGHNMNTYVRYVNSQLALYRNDVTSSGKHNLDGTTCLLWPLVGTAADYSAATCMPTVAMATDVNNYHHTPHETSSFGTYCAAANAYLEYQLLSAVQAQTKAFARTAMPLNVIQLVPGYYASVLEGTSSSIASCGQTFMGTGGRIICVPYFNFANPSDNGSNPGRSTDFESAFPSTVQTFWLLVVPTFAAYPIMEADTAPTQIAARVAATDWNQFASVYSAMPYVGSYFGYQKNTINALVIDHNYGNLQTWGGLWAVAHMWGTDSYLSLSGQVLSNYNVVIGLPNSSEDNSHTADMALLEAYVSAGGTLIVYTSSGAPSSLTGIGTTAVAIPYGHPITQPYTKAALNAAMPSGYGYINQYGSGRVITLIAHYYGDGFGVGDSTNNTGEADGLSSGLAYLTINAVLWAAGQATGVLYLPEYVLRTSWAAPLNGNGEGGNPPVLVSILGTPSGTKLVWISNTSTSAETIQLGLSQAFFGTPSSWKAYNASTKGIAASGSGNVVLNMTAPAQGWTPLYLQPSSSQTTTPTARLIVVE
jgi:hypothetical protein